MELLTRSIGNLQHKMQELNSSIFIHQFKNDRTLEDLANKAKAADTPDDLNPVDQMFLKNIQTKK
jgi:hypothetical protein